MSVIGKKYNLLILLGMFLILYNPPLLPFNMMHMVGLCSLAYLALQLPSLWKNIYLTKLIYVVGLFVFLLFYLLLEMLGHSLSATSLAFPIYYLMDVIPFGLTLAVYSSKKGLTTQSFLDMVLFIGMVQAVLALLAFLFPPVKTLFVELLLSRGYDDIVLQLARNRMYGLAGGLTYSTPVMQSILALVAVYFSFTRSKKYLLCAGLLIFSAVINARTTFVVLLIGGAVLLFCSKLKFKKKVSILLWTALISAFVGLYLFPLLMEVAPETFRWVAEGFKEIGGFLQGDTTGYFSYVANEQSYAFPTGLSLLWGVGHIVMGGYGGFGSDIGYINDIWFGGILYMAVVYPFFLRMMWSLFRKKEGALSFLGISLLFLYPALNIKGIAFSMNDFTNFFILIYIMGVVRKPQICPQIEKEGPIYER